MKKRHLEEVLYIIEELRCQSLLTEKLLVMMYSVFLSLDSGKGKLLKGTQEKSFFQVAYMQNGRHGNKLVGIILQEWGSWARLMGKWMEFNMV